MVLPGKLLYQPGAQSRHTALLPAPSCTDAVPAGHVTHPTCVWPVSWLYVPPGHGVQAEVLVWLA